MLLASITGMIMESRALDQPFPVYGYIKDSDGDALPAGVSVVVKDITKGTQITVATQAGGYYQADLFNLENCEDGDSIEVSCSYNNEENSKVFTLNVAETSKNISFNLIGSPSVSTKDATNIAGTSAKLNGQLTDLGGASSCEVWFEYGKTTSYGHSTSHVTKTSPASFSATISSLKPDTTYHFRAVAKNSKKTTYGADKTFHTPAISPQVSTSAATNVGYNSATLNGYLSVPGASSCEVWFVYDTVSHENWWEYAHETAHSTKTSSSYFSFSLTGLDMDTTYHFRAVAKNSAGNASGADRSFTTHMVFPTISTIDASNVTTTSALLKGKLIDMGGDDKCQVWFEYGENTSYGYVTETINLSSTGEFSLSAGNLLPGRTYHFRAVAKNEKGISYGQDKNFSTPSAMAEVKTGGIDYAIILKGNLTDMGGDEECQVWFEYWKEGENATETEKQVMNATGTFEAVISGLEEGVTYHYRTVVENSRGVAYGTNLSFTMFSLPSPPEVETLDVLLNGTNATLTANLTSLGESDFCYLWFEYWNGEKFSTSVKKVNETGVVNASIENLQEGMRYFYRAVAVGSNGRISYGEVKNFTITKENNSIPSISIIYPENGSVVNVNVSLMVNVSDEDGDMLTVKFYLDGVLVHSLTTKSRKIGVSLSLDYGREYSWYASVDDGINVSITPVFNFRTVNRTVVNFTFTTPFAGEEVIFNDTSIGDIVQWFWQFGDGAVSYEQNATHLYNISGTYWVNLTIEDAYGNSYSMVKEIWVMERGDANMDGKINALDITKMERIIHHEEEVECPHPADVNGDNSINQEDLNLLIHKILGD